MTKCVIIPAFIEGELKELFKGFENEYVICADGGYKKAFDAGIRPDLIIGDFDSYGGELPSDIPIERLPVEKDDTDTGRSVAFAIEEGFTDITILGGIGGRFDHTMANVQTLAGACDKGINIRMISDGNEITVVKNGTIVVKERPGWKLGVFSLSETATGIDLEDVYYSLKDAALTRLFPLGVSNEFLPGKDAKITVKDGMLLVVVSKD